MVIAVRLRLDMLNSLRLVVLHGLGGLHVLVHHVLAGVHLSQVLSLDMEALRRRMASVECHATEARCSSLTVRLIPAESMGIWAMAGCSWLLLDRAAACWAIAWW